MAFKRFVKKDNRNECLAALFVKASTRGIDQAELRNEIAPAVIKKRLSQATAREIQRVIKHIEGEQPSDDPQIRKIFYLWGQLHKAGKVETQNVESLRKYVKRMTGTDVLEWLKKDQKSEVIEALKQWLER